MIYRFTLALLCLTLGTPSIHAQESNSTLSQAESECLQNADFTHKACKLKVTFRDKAYKKCKGITSWKWEFGDGTRAFGKKVKHKFGFVGRYEVFLYYYDANGDQLGKISKTINVDVK